jgi:hypothetical protein
VSFPESCAFFRLHFFDRLSIASNATSRFDQRYDIDVSIHEYLRTSTFHGDTQHDFTKTNEFDSGSRSFGGSKNKFINFVELAVIKCSASSLHGSMLNDHVFQDRKDENASSPSPSAILQPAEPCKIRGIFVVSIIKSS